MDANARVRVYETMLRIRGFEEEVARQHQAGTIVGSVHLCIGQESIYAGSVIPLDLTVDRVFPTYRGHGWAIACGAPLEGMFAEMMGRATGISGGRGGSAYLTAPEVGMFGENSIVGAGAPIATGAALAAKYDGSNRVTIAAFGDGAINQGSVSEAMNFAAVEKLPVIFVIENNSYSELTPISRSVVRTALYTRASAFGIPGARINGNDPEKVESAMAFAVDRARQMKGPSVIEMTTERLVGHYIGDQQSYRPRGELATAKRNDPLFRYRKLLLNSDITLSKIQEAENDVVTELETALAQALAAPPANPANVLEHLYA